MITGATYEVRSTDVLDTLGWQTLDAKRLENNLIMMQKILTTILPLTQTSFSANEMQFRLTMICVVAIQIYICLPKPHSEFLQKSFRYSSAMQWNRLLEDSKNSETLSSFKKKIRQL